MPLCTEPEYYVSCHCPRSCAGAAVSEWYSIFRCTALHTQAKNYCMTNEISIIKHTICSKITTKQNWPLATIGSLHDKSEENFCGIFAIYAFDLEWEERLQHFVVLSFEVSNMCSLKY